MLPSSPMWMILTQILGVSFFGWCQWSLSGELSLIIPMMGLIATIFMHQVHLFRSGQLPKMPNDFRKYWKISIGWSLIMTLVFCVFQPIEEVIRVAKVLPVLVVGLSIMDCVLLVCVAEMVRHLWGD